MLICSFDETIKMDPLSHFGLQMSTWASSRKLEKAKIIINAKSLQSADAVKVIKKSKICGMQVRKSWFKKMCPYLAHLHMWWGKLAVDFIHVAHCHPCGQGAWVSVQSGPSPGPWVVTLSRKEPGVRARTIGEERHRAQGHDVSTTEAAL